MSGWRDADGRTVADRRKQERAADRARFKETLRHRPLTLVRAALGFAFVLLLAFALINALA